MLWARLLSTKWSNSISSTFPPLLLVSGNAWRLWLISFTLGIQLTFNNFSLSSLSSLRLCSKPMITTLKKKKKSNNKMTIRLSFQSIWKINSSKHNLTNNKFQPLPHNLKKFNSQIENDSLTIEKWYFLSIFILLSFIDKRLSRVRIFYI